MFFVRWWRNAPPTRKPRRRGHRPAIFAGWGGGLEGVHGYKMGYGRICGNKEERILWHHPLIKRSLPYERSATSAKQWAERIKKLLTITAMHFGGQTRAGTAQPRRHLPEKALPPIPISTHLIAPRRPARNETRRSGACRWGVGFGRGEGCALVCPHAGGVHPGHTWTCSRCKCVTEGQLTKLSLATASSELSSLSLERGREGQGFFGQKEEGGTIRSVGRGATSVYCV